MERKGTRRAAARGLAERRLLGREVNWGAPGELGGLLGSLPLALVGIDGEGKIAFWSNGRQQAFRNPSALALGQPVEAVLKRMARRYHAPGLEGLALLIRASLRGRKSASGWQFQISCKGVTRVIQADFSPLQGASNGDQGGGVLVFQDVSARERLEEETREVSHLASLGELAACIAHEIRNPLSAVKAAAQFLVQENVGNGEVSHYAGIIDREATRLHRLVGDILLYARPPSTDRLPASVEDLLKKCHSLLEKEAADRGVSLECSLKGNVPLIFADFEAVLQILVNLAKNSLEASKRGGKVRITAECASEEGPLEVVVSDTGSGISRGNLEKVFLPFFTTKSSGTGLGLPIAKKIVESQGGSLTLSSRPGRGTRARVFLPIPKSERVRR